MAGETTRLTIELEVLLRNLNRTLRGLSQIEQRLRRVAAIRVNPAQTSSTQRATLAAQRLALAQQRLQLQQQRLQITTQNIATAQGRATVAAQRLTLAQQRLTQAQQRLNTQAQQTVVTHVALNRTLTSLGNSFRSIGQGLASVGATLTFSVTAPLIALGNSIVDAAVRMDSLRRGLTTMAGSSREANIQLERLTQLAKLPGIGFEEAIQGSIRLQAVGFSAAEAERALRQFSNAIALTGGGREDLANVTVQLGQMAAQSKVLAQDLKPIISSAPVVAQVMREAFGTVRSEEIQELGVSSKQFIDTLIAGLENLPRAAAGARNSFENFRDELFRAAAVVGTTLLPALTRLVEVAGPIITKLADAFAALPVPLQVIGVGFVALLAAIGPVTFVVGILVTGIGRLLVGFAQLNATGILPTIANLRALTAGTLSAAAAQRTLAATTALVAGGVGALLTVLATVVTAFAIYKAFQKDSVALSKEQADALTDQIKGLKEQAEFLDGLKSGVERTANEQERLLEIYSSLNQEAKVRVTGIEEEEKRLAALREEIAKVVALREQERIQAAASIVGELANNLLKVQANERERQSIASRVQANAALIETLKREQQISAAVTRELALRGITASTVESAIGALKTESQNLSESQDKLITSGKELNDLSKDQVAIVRALERQTGLTARQLLVVAQNTGRFRADVAAMIPVLEEYIRKTDEATGSTDKFNASLSENERRLSEAGKQADELQKKRQGQIANAAATAREASSSLEDALRLMQFLINTTPELRASLERESQIAGKSIGELMRKAVESAFGGRDRAASGRGLRNALQQLADAESQVRLAQKDRAVEIEKDGIEAQLRAAEVGQRLRLLSYREYLENRAALTADSLSKEINQQQEVVKAAREAQIRLLAEAKRPGLEADERARRQAQAAGAEEEAIKAETKLIILQRQRERITIELQQALAEAQQQQIADVAQLEIRYAELQGRIEDALKAATVEEFREQLESLGKAQKFLNEQVNKATGERRKQLEVERRLNQRQIESILNQIRARDALAELAAAERLVENAKNRQQKLEEDLRFEVEHRGLSEEASIQRRLEGEQKLKNSLTDARNVIILARKELEAFGATPPPQLQEFIDQMNASLLGLADLPFTEKFRLVEKEFNRINDERLRRIEDVRRKVEERDLAEVVGMLKIRAINAEYAGDLIEQARLLTEIARLSGDANLRRQAQAAEDTVKDANSQLASFGKQLRSTAIDAARSSFVEFFQSLRDSTISAKDRILNLIDSVVNRINEVIAENLFDELMKSIFGDGSADTEGGILAGIKRLFGFGGGGEQEVSGGDLGAQLLQSQTALETGAVTAATTLTTAAATAAATETTAAAGFATAITAAASGFVAAVTAAGAAFAAAVAAASTAQGFSTGLSAAGGSGIGNFAVGDLIPARRGGVLATIAEGGYPEAVLTTDPKHAQRQLAILRAFLAKTRGLGGRIPGFAIGDFVTPDLSLNVPSVSLPTTNFNDLEVGRSSPSISLRNINLFDRRQLVGGYMRSAEGSRDFLNNVSEHADEIGRRLGIK